MVHRAGAFQRDIRECFAHVHPYALHEKSFCRTNGSDTIGVPAKDPAHRALRVRSDPCGLFWFRVQGCEPGFACVQLRKSSRPFCKSRRDIRTSISTQTLVQICRVCHRGKRKLRPDVGTILRWNRAKCVCPVCLGSLQSGDTQTFSLLFEKVRTIPIVEDSACNICKKPVFLDLETHRETGNGIDFVNGLGADVESDHHEHNIDTLETTPWKFSSTTLVLRGTITVGGDRAVFSRITQIVTSAVREICACIVSRVSREFPVEQGLGHQVG